MKHDRSSPRYVAVLLGSVAAALSAFRRLQTAGHEPTFGTNDDVKVRPNLQCYPASAPLPYCVVVTFTNDGGTLCRMSKLYLINPNTRNDEANKVSRGHVSDSNEKYSTR